MARLTLSRRDGESVVVVDKQTGQEVLRTTAKAGRGKVFRTIFDADPERYDIWREEIWQQRKAGAADE